MKDKVANVKIKLISDRPTNDDRLGTHLYIAKMLVRLVSAESDNPLVIGLFGGWGTGKSSIAQIYDEIITQESNVKNIYIDSWAYANARERFAAGFLTSMAQTLIKNQASREKIIKDIDLRTEKWETSYKLGPKTYILVGLVFFVLLVIMALAVLLVGINDEIRLNLILFLASTLVVNGILNWILPRIMVSYESKTVDESFNKIDHFRRCFEYIIKKSSYKTISVVVDNLDRSEPGDALEIIRMLKTFVDESILDRRRFVIIIPCDEHELAEHILKVVNVKDPYEFLRKFFNVSLQIPELVHENIINFTKAEFEKVSGSLEPRLSDEDANLAMFILSRSARRNPREVKTLINSFIALWDTAGMSGLAGKDNGISPLGAAIYVCIKYHLQDYELPKKFEDLYETEFDEGNERLKEFLYSIEEFRDDISDLEWASLKKLQLSDDERNIPNFLDIYFSITDLNWESVDDLVEDSKIENLIARLDVKIREGDSVARLRFIKWILYLLAQKKIQVKQLPRTLSRYIRLILTKRTDDWYSILGEGLAEFIFQDEIPGKLLVAKLVDLQEKLDKEIPGDTVVSFLEKFLSLSRQTYWMELSAFPDASLALDGVLTRCISKKPQIIKSVLNNIHVVISETTGTKLGDELANRFQELNLGDTILNPMFIDQSVPPDGALAFAGQWMKRVDISSNVNVREKVVLTLHIIQFFLQLPDQSAIKDSWLPDDRQWMILTDNIAVFCERSINQHRLSDSFNALMSISLFSIWMEGHKKTEVANHGRDVLLNRIWPNFSPAFGQLAEEDQGRFADLLDQYPRLIDHIQHDHLAILCQYANLNILKRLISSGRINQFENVIGDVIASNYWDKALKIFISDIANISAEEEKLLDQSLSSIYKMMQQKRPSIDKYQMLADGIKPIKRKSANKLHLKQHILWLINNTNWNDKNSIESGVKKIQILEMLAPIDKEVVEHLRTKLVGIGGIDIIASVLSDDSRSWITKHLSS